MKAVKNATELEGFRQSHVRDGSALARYFAWLEEQLNNGVEIDESQGADQLEKFRSWVFIANLQASSPYIGVQGARFVQRTFIHHDLVSWSKRR